MNENRHPIDDLFRDGLSQHSVEAPMHVWERIDQTRTPVYKLLNNFKQNSRWYLSVAVGMVLMSSAAIMFLSNEPQKELEAGNSNAPASQIETGSGTETGNPSSKGTEAFNSTVPKTDITASVYPPSPQGSENDPTALVYNEESGSDAGELRNEPISPIVPKAGRTRTGFNAPLPIYPGNDPAPEKEEVAENPKGIPATAPTEPSPAPVVPDTDLAEVKTDPATAPSVAPDDKKSPNVPPKEASKWALEVLGSWDFMNRTMQNADPAYAKARKDAEKMGAAYTFQFRAQYRLNDMFALRSGVSFSQHHEKLDFTRTENSTEIVERQETGYILDPINGPTPITYTVRDTLHHSVTTTAKANNTYTFVDIPVLLNYTFYTSNKWNLGVSGGPMFNMVFRQKGQILGPVNNEVIDLNSSANPFRSFAGVNLMLNVSASYQLNDRFDLLFEPGVRYGVSSLTNKEFGVAQKYSSVNLFTGVRYRF